METKTHSRIKYLLYVLLLLFSLLLQTSVFGTLQVIAAPCLIPVAVVCIAILEGPDKGSILGLVAGCLWAWSTGLTVYGVYCIVLLPLLGIFTGIVAERVLLQGWKTALTLSALAVFCTSGVSILFRILLGRLPGNTLATLFLPVLLFSLIGCLLYFPITLCISRIGGFHG